ncbi:MAG: hypothetical protein ACYCW6_19930 [Candidatus Xenobia bacterium]
MSLTVSSLSARPFAVGRDNPTPAPAPPDIDFSTIDSPAKAAVLPALNPVTLLTLVQTTAQAAQAGFGLSSAISGNLGASTAASMNYTMADPSTATLSGHGTFGAAAFQESYQFDPTQGLLISGQIGNSAESLKLSDGQDGTHIDGTIGSVAVHEVLTNGGDDQNPKILIDGTLGGQKLHEELCNKPSSDPNGSPTLHMEGTLGSQAITLDENVTAQQDNGATLSATGNIAGVAVNLQHSLQLQAPPAPPAPPTGDPNPDPSPSGKK